MRLATYNVEWMTALFDADGLPLVDAERSARPGITRGEQLEALAIVLTALDADAVLIVEAPDHTARRPAPLAAPLPAPRSLPAPKPPDGATPVARAGPENGTGRQPGNLPGDEGTPAPGSSPGDGRTVRALQRFAADVGLRTSRALVGFVNETEQEIALLYDPAALAARHDPQGAPTGKKGAPDAPRFDGVFRIDLDIDATLDLVRFSKPPLELAVVPATGRPFRLIGVHVKSKAPHGASDPEGAMRRAIAARRKQLAQCIWLRQRVEAHLAAGERLVVLGDFNDGPGLDRYEALFGRSGVEIVMGADAPPPLRLHDPHVRRALAGRLPAIPATARFYIEEERSYLSALLDYIMVSPDLAAERPRWRIWHPFDDPGLYAVPELREALLAASDHFPVTLDFTP